VPVTAARRSGRSWALVAGVVVAVALVAPPTEAWARGSLTDHMVQHVLLIGVAAPLVAVGAPAPRRRRGAGLLAAAVVTQTVAVLAWHAPVLFDAAEAHVAVHALEHLSLFGAAVLLWWAAARAGGPEGWGPGALAVFVAVLPMTVLGLGLLLARTPWYAQHRSLADQQVAGVVMWSVGGVLALVGALALGAAWIARATEAAQAPRRDRRRSTW
jgi:cytochrome c oxidase assembly factor CtaG